VSPQAAAKAPSRRMNEQDAKALARRDCDRQAKQRAARDAVEASDDLLDEIDAVLEETAVQHRFVQRGGQ